MKQEQIVRYVESLGSTKVVAERVWAIHLFYEKVCPEAIDDLFISEYVNADQSRTLESLWFFSKSFAMEAKEFLSTDNFDMTSTASKTRHYRIIKTNYDFEKATATSRMSVNFALNTGVVGEFKSSSENCDHVRDVFVKYFGTVRAPS